MYCSSMSCTFPLKIVDELTKDVYTMIEQQGSSADCIREVLLDFVRANGIVEDYVNIPEKERLERFFGYTEQSGRTAGIPQGKDSEIQSCPRETSHPDMLTYTTANGTKIHISVEQPA